MKNFRINILLRVALLAATIGPGSYLVLETGLTALAVLTGIITLIVIYDLFRYIDVINGEVRNFLEAIQYSDFSMHSRLHMLGGSFRTLSAQINKVMDQFQNARKEKEEQYLYLQMVIQHIGVGLITFDINGKVELINHAAKKILRIKTINQIQALDETISGFGAYLIGMPVRKKQIYKAVFSDDMIQMLLFATEFRMRDRNLKMIILQNIQSELEEKELDAWQKLIRVLTHEIINSITPISSMTGTVQQLVRDNVASDASVNREAVHDVLTALCAIQKRSEGMVAFVEKFRNLTKVPQPNFRTFALLQLFDRIRILMSAILKERGIHFISRVTPDNLELTADPNLIEQVIINLIHNAVQALRDIPGGKIELTALIDETGKVVISVLDNGPGIPEDIQEKIFIPFFTTRQDGSGIGLSLSRQIMRAHGGSIKVNSAPNQETVFTLRF